jgi:hypothetical protein
MPNDVKAIVSVVTLLAALAFAYWEATVAQAVPAWFVVGFTSGMTTRGTGFVPTVTRTGNSMITA